MLVREISKVIGYYLYFLALALCIPLFIALYFEFISPEYHPQPHSSQAFLYTVLICLLTAVSFHLFGKKSTGLFFRREGLIVVVLIWFITSIIGGLPFWLSHTLENPVDAYFEAMSGLTTTGSTVMAPKKYNDLGEEIPIQIISSEKPFIHYKFYGTINPVIDAKTGKVLYTGIEAVSKAVLFWRSFLQWLGGMGIVVLFVAILPAFGVGGKVLFQTEVPGPTKESVAPRIKETASFLWKIYLALSIIQVILLMTVSSLPFFDAITIAFSTLSTGGFSIKNASIGAYHNPSLEWITTIFMILGSINFTLYFYAIRGKIYRLFEPELLSYLVILCLGTFFIVANLSGTINVHFDGYMEKFTLPSAIRHGAFQFVSTISSTGFDVANYTLWPYFSQAIMLVSMFIGGMSGSTSGGIKVIRHYILCKSSFHKMETIYRPDAVRRLRVADKEISNKVLTTVLVFFFIVIFLSMLATLLYILDGIDSTTALSLTGCMFNNIGISFGVSAESCAFMSAGSKVLSTLWMVLGRLEYFAVLILLIPAFWKDR